VKKCFSRNLFWFLQLLSYSIGVAQQKQTNVSGHWKVSKDSLKKNRHTLSLFEVLFEKVTFSKTSVDSLKLSRLPAANAPPRLNRKINIQKSEICMRNKKKKFK
jgi:hypothetical protein